MKKFIAYLLVALMSVSCLAACGNTENENTNTDAKAAVDYVFAMYKEESTETAKDFTRTTQVMIGGKPLTVEWTVDNEAVKITVDGTNALIDVNEETEEAIEYTLTASVTDADGNKASKDFKYTIPAYVPAPTTPEAILKAAYDLEKDTALEGTYTLEGVITTVNTPWSADYKNISVTIQVGDLADMPIQCFRLKDGTVTGAEGLKVGDTIKVTGTIKKYGNTVEFDAGCTLEGLTAGAGGSSEETPDDKPADTTPSGDLSAAEIMALVEALAENTTLEGTYKLSGKVLEVSEVSSYGDVNVTFEVDGTDGKTMYCYGLKGEGNTDVKVGDIITVEGTIKDYNGLKEFHLPQLVERKASGNADAGTDKPADTPETTAPAVDASAKEILTAAYALADNASLGSQKYTLTGVITEFKYTYSPDFDNIQCTIVVDGLTDMPIVCYKLKGEGIDKVVVGSTITVTGEIKNYNGMVEFNGCTLDSYK